MIFLANKNYIKILLRYYQDTEEISMKILVYSKNPLTELEKTRVKDIIRQSHCPNESLKNTFNRFAFMQGDSIIYFDDVTVQNRHTALCTELKA